MNDDEGWLPDDEGHGERFELANQQRDAPQKPEDTSSWPFQCLGYDRDRFFLYTEEGRQVLSYTARALHSSADLVALAPIRFFEDNFPGKMGFDIKRAGNSIVRACYRAGIFDRDALRGRGVWMDQGRCVLHLGDRLVVDGGSVPLASHISDFIYERGRALPIAPGAPLTDAEGRRLLAFVSAVAWGNPDRDSRVLLGWIVSAIIGGALAWRPHLWMTSAGGGGKTWVLNHIVKPLLGPLAVSFEGQTTASGILGEMGRDIRPVVFEEAETQTPADRERMQAIINLARSASSSDSAGIAKGTQDGGSRRAQMRGSFIFASINSGMTQAADERRIVPITLANGSPDQFKALKEAEAEVMTPAICGQLLARLLGMLPTIRHNIETLGDAIARTGVGREIGDTLGTLMACALAVITAEELDAEAAKTFVESRDWLLQAAQDAVVLPEHDRALAHFLQAEGARINDGGRVYAVPIGEMIESIATFSDLPPIKAHDAIDILGRHGIRVDTREGFVILYNQSRFITDAFAPTPWAAGWRTTLARIDGAKHPTSVRFPGGLRGRALALPLSTVLGSENG